MSSRRGSVIVESALVLTVILFLLYGALQLGIVGLEQLTVDGGAFTYAHQQSFVGGSKSYVDGLTVAKQTLTHLNSPNVAGKYGLAEPPATLFQGQYNFSNQNARYGGVSLIQPAQATATLTRSNIQNLILGVAGTSLSVVGSSIEPAYRLINGHANVEGNTFGSAPSFATAVDPLADSAPPYFVGFDYLQMCTYAIAINAVGAWSTCPNASLVTAIGSAEYLDAHNWGRTVNGVTPSTTAVFWEMRYHQKLYADISGLLAGKDLPTKAIVLDPLNRTHDVRASDVACVYSFDNNYSGSYAPGVTGFGDPLFALHPEGTSPVCPAR